MGETLDYERCEQSRRRLNWFAVFAFIFSLHPVVYEFASTNDFWTGQPLEVVGRATQIAPLVLSVPLSIFLSLKALFQIREHKNVYRGGWLAIAALVISFAYPGYIGVYFFLNPGNLAPHPT